MAAGVVALAGVVAAARLSAGGSAGESKRGKLWQRDIAYLARELPKVHVGGVTGVTGQQWDAAAGRLESGVPRLSNGQVILGGSGRG